MDRELIELYGYLEECKLEFDNSFTEDDKEYARLKVIEISNIISKIKRNIKGDLDENN